MKYELKNGEVIEIRQYDSDATPAKFLQYISKIVKERPEVFLLVNRVPTMQEEAEWVNSIKSATKKRSGVSLVAWSGNKIIGEAQGLRGKWRDGDKVCIGISVARNYRKQGLGRKLMTEVIKLVKKRLRPKIIYLTAVTDNTSALGLYKKVGFKEIARLPKWQKVRGKYRDYIYMGLKR